MCVSPKFVRNGVAHFLGSVAVMATPEWRLKMAAANVQECLGVDEARARQIAEDSLHRFGRMIVEVMRFPLLKPDNIDKLVTVDGLEYLEKAYKEGKGVIMATGHFGNWELLGATVALHGYPMLSITRKQNNSQMDRFINEYREMVGQKVAYNRGKSGLLAISRMLKEKHLLGVLFDQDTNDDGVEIELFGKKCITPYGPAALSRLYGSPILPIFMHNNPDGTLRAKIYPPLYTPRTKDKEKDFYDVTKELITVLEHEIIENPPMWFWVHDRWKDGRQRFAGKKINSRQEEKYAESGISADFGPKSILYGRWAALRQGSADDALPGRRKYRHRFCQDGFTAASGNSGYGRKRNFYFKGHNFKRQRRGSFYG